MNRLASMTVAAKLTLGFVCIVVLMVISGGVAYMALNSVVGRLAEIKDDNVPKISWINSVNYDVLNIARSLRNGLLEIDDKEKAELAIKKVLETRAHIKETIGKLEAHVHDPESKAALKKILDARLAFIEGQDVVIGLLRANKAHEAKVFLLTEMQKRQATYAAATGDFQSLQEKFMAAAGEDAEQRSSRALISIFLSVLVAAVLSAVIAWLIVRDLSRRLGGEPAYVAEMVGAISSGDLSQRIRTAEHDRSSMLYSVNSMQCNLSALVSEIKHLVAAAAQGDFSNRITLEGKQGFGLEIAAALNQISEMTRAGLEDIVQVSQALAEGDLTAKIEDKHPGLFGLATTAVNGTVDSLRNIVSDIEAIVLAANHGDFSVRVSLAGKKGFALELSEQLNQLSETTERGLMDIMRVTSALARGDLTASIDKPYPGMFGETQVAINATVRQLTALIGKIKEITQLIATAASEISAGNQDLSSRTEQQASSLEETASSMEELNATVKNNAENAIKANDLALASNEIALRSGKMMNEVVSTMAEIQGSSRQIEQILGVIDGIAFQTNILALNAAVEAARAGEQGRGFAVVATEVRNLAKRSADAAKQIKALIGESALKTQAGGDLVQKTGSMMAEMIGSFEQVVRLAADISSASQEQSSGIDQVTLAVGQMDEVTQQNAALVEQAAAAAESLADQADELSRAVSQFTFKQRESAVLLLPDLIESAR